MVSDMPRAGGDTPSGNHELTVCTHVDDTVYGGSSDEVCDEFYEYSYRRMVHGIALRRMCRKYASRVRIGLESDLGS